MSTTLPDSGWFDVPDSPFGPTDPFHQAYNEWLGYVEDDEGRVPSFASFLDEVRRHPQSHPGLAGLPVPTSAARTAMKTRAWDLQAGDVLSPVGLTVKRVIVDPPGANGRMVHVQHDLGMIHLPLNASVAIQGQRPSQTSAAKQAANPYTPAANPYVNDAPEAPGTPDSSMDGPPPTTLTNVQPPTQNKPSGASTETTPAPANNTPPRNAMKVVWPLVCRHCGSTVRVASLSPMPVCPVCKTAADMDLDADAEDTVEDSGDGGPMAPWSPNSTSRGASTTSISWGGGQYLVNSDPGHVHTRIGTSSRVAGYGDPSLPFSPPTSVGDPTDPMPEGDPEAVKTVPVPAGSPVYTQNALDTPVNASRKRADLNPPDALLWTQDQNGGFVSQTADGGRAYVYPNGTTWTWQIVRAEVVLAAGVNTTDEDCRDDVKTYLSTSHTSSRKTSEYTPFIVDPETGARSARRKMAYTDDRGDWHNPGEKTNKRSLDPGQWDKAFNFARVDARIDDPADFADWVSDAAPGYMGAMQDIANDYPKRKGDFSQFRGSRKTSEYTPYIEYTDSRPMQPWGFTTGIASIGDLTMVRNWYGQDSPEFAAAVAEYQRQYPNVDPETGGRYASRKHARLVTVTAPDLQVGDVLVADDGTAATITGFGEANGDLMDVVCDDGVSYEFARDHQVQIQQPDAAPAQAPAPAAPVATASRKQAAYPDTTEWYVARSAPETLRGFVDVAGPFDSEAEAQAAKPEGPGYVTWAKRSDVDQVDYERFMTSSRQAATSPREPGQPGGTRNKRKCMVCGAPATWAVKQGSRTVAFACDDHADSFTSATGVERVAADKTSLKVAQIVAAILRTNPSMPRHAAQKVAHKTVARYPAVVR